MVLDVEKLIERAFRGELIEELAVKLICMKLKELFITEDNV